MSNLSILGRTSGFTLLEIMAVLFVISLFVGIVAANFDLFGLQAENELEQFLATFRSAQWLAVNSGQPVQAHFSPKNDLVEFKRDGEIEDKFKFASLELEQPENKFVVKMVPTNITGPKKINLSARTVRYRLVPDRIFGLQRQIQSDDL